MFVCEQLGPFELKGFSEPVMAWRVLGERVGESRFAAIRSKKLTRFVGRQNELHQLYGLWKRAKGGKGQVALLCGEAGIGKSRISKTLLDRIAGDPHVTIRLQCSPYHTNSPFYPIITQHEHAAHFQRLDPPEVKLEKLEALLSQIGPEIVADAPLYAALLSIPTDGRYPALDLTPRRQKDLTIEALTRQVLTLARTKPVLFVIEDAHWIDPSTLEGTNRFIEAVKTAPVLLLITFRPEFFPPWLDQPHVTMIQHQSTWARQSQRDNPGCRRRQGIASRSVRADHQQDRWGSPVCRGTHQDGAGVRAAPGCRRSLHHRRPAAASRHSDHTARFIDGAS